MRDRTEIAADLRSAIDEGIALFNGIPEARTAYRPAPDRWSARQIIGHLIDSASNNHRRFIINQGTDTLLVGSYEQEHWVERQQYGDIPASELLALWTAYNRHLAHVIEAMSPHDFGRARGSTNDYQFNYMVPRPTGEATLGHLVEDYVAHLRHHLAQIGRLFAG